MLTFSDSDIRSKIKSSLKQNADHIAFLPFQDVRESVIDDIEVVKSTKLLFDVPVTGYIYEVTTGKLVKVIQ